MPFAMPRVAGYEDYEEPQLDGSEYDPLADAPNQAPPPPPLFSPRGPEAEAQSKTFEALSKAAQESHPERFGDENAGGGPAPSEYGPRFSSAEPKGQGYFGPLKRPNGDVMTEYSIGVDLDGKETQIPTLVPTLTRDEVNALLNAKDGEPVPQRVIEKATAYATDRLKAGKSPFAVAGEQQPAPEEDRPFRRYDTQGQQRMEGQAEADRQAREAIENPPERLSFGEKLHRTTAPFTEPLNAAEEATRIPYVTPFIEDKVRPVAAKAFNASPAGGAIELARAGLGEAGIDTPDVGELVASQIPATGLDIGLAAAPLAGKAGEIAGKGARAFGAKAGEALAATAAEDIKPQVYRLAVKDGAAELPGEEFAMSRADGSQILKDPAGVRILKPGEEPKAGESLFYHGALEGGLKGDLRPGLFMTPEEDAAKSYADTSVLLAQIQARKGGPLSSVRRLITSGETGSLRFPGDAEGAFPFGPRGGPQDTLAETTETPAFMRRDRPEVDIDAAGQPVVRKRVERPTEAVAPEKAPQPTPEPAATDIDALRADLRGATSPERVAAMKAEEAAREAQSPEEARLAAQTMGGMQGGRATALRSQLAKSIEKFKAAAGSERGSITPEDLFHLPEEKPAVPHETPPAPADAPKPDAQGNITLTSKDITFKPEAFQTRDVTPGLPYNRERVAQISRNWDPAQFTAPKVVADPENPGKYVVMEGQHRIPAWQQATGDAPMPARVAPYDITEPQQLAKARLEANRSNTTTKPLNVREELRNLRDAEAAGLSHDQVTGEIGKSETYVQKLRGVANLGDQAADRVVQEPALFDHAAAIGQAMDKYGLSPEDGNGLFNRVAKRAKDRPTVTAMNEMLQKYGEALQVASQLGMFDTEAFGGSRGALLDLIDKNARITTQLNREIAATGRNVKGATSLGASTEEGTAAAEELRKIGSDRIDQLRSELARNEADVLRAVKESQPTAQAPLTEAPEGNTAQLNNSYIAPAEPPAGYAPTAPGSEPKPSGQAPLWTPDKGSLPKRVLDETLDALSIVSSRTLQAGLDLSYPFRQAGVLVRRKEFWKAWPQMKKALLSGDFAAAHDAELRKLPFLSPEVHISGLPGTSTAEETMTSRILQHLPGYKQTDRAVTTFINDLRANVSNDFGKALARGENGFDAHAQAVNDQFGNYVNRVTGRGNLGPAEDWAPALNQVFYSARRNVAMVQAPLYMFAKYPEVRLEAMKDFVSFFTAGMGTLALMDAAGVGSVSIDPTSADFGKVKIGHTRLDIWGGYQQMARVTYKIANGELKDPGSAAFTDAAVPFLRNKLSPLAGGVVDLAKGTDTLGRKLGSTPTPFGNAGPLLNELYKRFTPLAYAGIAEALAEDGLKGAAVAATGIVGEGSQTYVSPTEEREAAAKALIGDTKQTAAGRDSYYANLSIADKHKVDAKDPESPFSKREVAAGQLFPTVKPGRTGSIYDALSPPERHQVDTRAGIHNAPLESHPNTVAGVAEGLAKGQKGEPVYVYFGNASREINQDANSLKAWEASKDIVDRMQNRIITPQVEAQAARSQYGKPLEALDPDERSNLDSHIRQQFRTDNPEANAWAIYWGISTKVETPAAHDALQRIFEQYGKAPPTPSFNYTDPFRAATSRPKS